MGRHDDDLKCHPCQRPRARNATGDRPLSHGCWASGSMQEGTWSPITVQIIPPVQHLNLFISIDRTGPTIGSGPSATAGMAAITDYRRTDDGGGRRPRVRRGQR